MRKYWIRPTIFVYRDKKGKKLDYKKSKEFTGRLLPEIQKYVELRCDGNSRMQAIYALFMAEMDAKKAV